MEGYGSRSGSVQNNDGSESGRLENIGTDPSDPDPQH
jgi:hypothetical protein